MPADVERLDAAVTRFYEAHGWPGGAWATTARNAFCALLQITGKPSLALSLMDELELWRDDKRPEKALVDRWAHEWRTGKLTTKPKIVAAVQKQYDGLRRADMDETLRKANLAHRTISQTVIEGNFDKDTSGALQHLGQFVSIGTEKRQQAFDPQRQRDDKAIPMTPQFFLMPPPERRELSDGTIEGEVIGRS